MSPTLLSITLISTLISISIPSFADDDTLEALNTQTTFEYTTQSQNYSTTIESELVLDKITTLDPSGINQTTKSSTFNISYNNEYQVSRLIEKATEKNLSADPQWLALLHYNIGGTVRDRNQSYVDSEVFFLATDGKTNPQSELKASINILFTQPQQRCEFVARYYYLYTNLIVAEDSAKITNKNSQWQQDIQHCTDYLAFINNIPHDKLYLIFPGPYLNAPSSMFGHTLLRVGLDSANNSSDLLSNAITFSAHVPDNTGALNYFGKGLLGGFPGYYNLVPYFSKIQEYNNEENRNIWEYELAFDKQEIRRLMQHTWEIRNTRFDYYYLDENCSYRLLELLSVIRPNASWTGSARLAELPINTIKEVEKENLIVSTTFRPSMLEKIRNETAHLNADEKDWVRQLQSNIDAPANNLNNQQQARSLDVAYKVYKYDNRKLWHDKNVSKYGLNLLKKRAVLPIQPALEIEVPPYPQKAHGSRRVSAAWYEKHPNSKSGSSLSYRYAYHDLLDNSFAANRDFALEALELKLFLDSDTKEFAFQEFKLFDVRSLSPRTEFIKPLAWEFKVGIEDNNLDGDLNAYAGGGAGASVELFNNITAYSLIGGDLNWLESEKLQLSLSTKLGLYRQGHKLSWESAVKYVPWSSKTRLEQLSLYLGAQYHLSSNLGLRLTAEHILDKNFENQNTDNWQAVLNYYF